MTEQVTLNTSANHIFEIIKYEFRENERLEFEYTQRKNERRKFTNRNRNSEIDLWNIEHRKFESYCFCWEEVETLNTWQIRCLQHCTDELNRHRSFERRIH